MKEAVVDYVIT